MEWPLKKISEVAEIISGGTPKTDISEETLNKSQAGCSLW